MQQRRYAIEYQTANSARTVAITYPCDDAYLALDNWLKLNGYASRGIVYATNRDVASGYVKGTRSGLFVARRLGAVEHVKPMPATCDARDLIETRRYGIDGTSVIEYGNNR